MGVAALKVRYTPVIKQGVSTVSPPQQDDIPASHDAPLGGVTAEHRLATARISSPLVQDRSGLGHDAHRQVAMMTASTGDLLARAFEAVGAHQSTTGTGWMAAFRQRRRTVHVLPGSCIAPSNRCTGCEAIR
jgi:hypothetical protein